MPLHDVLPDPESHFCFNIPDEESMVHSVPYHRVKDVWKEGVLIW